MKDCQFIFKTTTTQFNGKVGLELWPTWLAYNNMHYKLACLTIKEKQTKLLNNQ